MVRYDDHYPRDEKELRIVVPVRIGEHEIPAIVDTGAVWNVLDPEIAEVLGLLPAVDPEVPEFGVIIRGEYWKGPVVRHQFMLVAEVGEDLLIEGSFFIPLDSGASDVWRHPNFLGLRGSFERVRFAVDARINEFAFAPT